MKKYHSYTIDDFVQDVYFRKWVYGTLPEQDHFWQTWLTTHPEQENTIEQARLIVLSLRIDEVSVDPREIEEAIQQILDDRVLIRHLPVYQRTWFRIAASVVLLCSISYSLWQRFLPGTHSGDITRLPAQTQAVSHQRVVALPDGSKVTLERNSDLTVSAAFDQDKREVTLVGEAFFEVVKNPGKPFLVNTGKIVTRVLGTSFRIKAYDKDSSISVSVSTGKVTVFKKRGSQTDRTFLSDEVILNPNQRAVFVRAGEQFIKTLVEKPVIVRATVQKNPFEFNETPVPQVLKILEEAYGVNMEYNAEVLSSCNLTASLNSQDLYQKLDLICEAIHAQYKIADGQIILSGRGCN